MSEQEDEVAPRQVAVIVAHGVGETQPGECVGLLARGLVEQMGATAGADAAVRLVSVVEPGAEPDAVQTVPVFTHKVDLKTGEQLAISEFYWAELGRLQPGQVNAILGLFRTIFEAHHFVGGMIDHWSNPVSRMLKFVLLLLCWMLRGPIAGLTACTAAVAATFLFLPAGLLSWPAPIAGNPAAVVTNGFLIANFAVFVVALLGAWALFRSRQTYEVWQDTVAWSLLVSAFFVIVGLVFDLPSALRSPDASPAALNVRWAVEFLEAFVRTIEIRNARLFDELQLFHSCILSDTCQQSDRINLMYAFIKIAWIIWGLLLIATVPLLVGILVLRTVMPSVRVQSSLTAVCVVILQFMLWSVVVVPVVLPILDKARDHQTMGALRADLAQKSTDCRSLQVRCEPPAPKEEAACATDKIGKEREAAMSSQCRDTRLSGFFGRLEYIQMDWTSKFKTSYAIVWSGLGFVILAGVLLAAVRSAVCGWCGSNLAMAERLMPRLLFGWMILAVLYLFAWIELRFVVIGRQSDWLPSYVAQWLPAVVVEWLRGEQIVNWLVTALAVVSPFLITRQFANGVHIARDLIDHQYQQSLVGSRFLFSGWVADLLGRTPGTRSRLPRRDLIQKRFQTVLDVFLKDRKFDQVVFVAHSQGSVIVFDYLRQASEAKSQLAGVKPAVLTFGSPLGHLYQKYFAEYRDLKQMLVAVRPEIKCWVNLFRVDDYIGQRVGGEAEDMIVNRPLPMGGHTGYWSQQEVAQELVALVRAG